LPTVGLFDLTPFKGQWLKFEIALSEQFLALREVLAEGSIVKIDEVLAEEKIGEVDTYHYRLVVDKDELKQAIIRIAGLTQEGIQISNLEIWIGKEDFYPYKFLIDLSIKNDQETELD
jgi:hypothetical protein